MILTKRCEGCGKIIYKSSREGYRDWNRRKYCNKICRIKYFMPSKENLEKRSKAMSLEKHPRWKENCIKTTTVLRKLLVRTGRDINKCEVCGKTNLEVNLHIHHKNKNKMDNNLDNLIVCCVPCHKRLDGYAYTVDYAKEHNISQPLAWRRLLPKNKLKELREKDRIKHNISYKLNYKKQKEASKKWYQNHKLKISENYKDKKLLN